MNPGGLRADMVGNAAAATRATLTYKQAAVVQPFANTLVNMQLTGAQIKTALEQQWQRDGAGSIPSRPFLRLGTSEGLQLHLRPGSPRGRPDHRDVAQRRRPSVATTSYSVTVNSFLGSGGDNFRAFAQGTQKRDTGKVDLQAMVDYMDEFANRPRATLRSPADFTQHSVGVDFPAALRRRTRVGDSVTFNLSSLAFSTAPTSRTPRSRCGSGEFVLGTFPVDNTIGTAVFDEYGTATVTVDDSQRDTRGIVTLKVTGNNTGTRVDVPITVRDDRGSSAISVPDVSDRVTDGLETVEHLVSLAEATGSVEASQGHHESRQRELVDSEATFDPGRRSLPVGMRSPSGAYSGDAQPRASTTTVAVTVTPAPVVEQATPTITASADPSC